MIGSVDDRRRPLVRIEPEAPASDGILCVVDTGFNGDLLLSPREVQRSGFALYEGYHTAQLADGRQIRVQRGTGAIQWIAGRRLVDVMVPLEVIPEARVSADEPLALLGTGLLTPYVLNIDFSTGMLVIAPEATGRT